MDAASFERVYDSLQEFHAFFAASFGRKQWRDHSGNYLQALLVQDQERRNAENLSESVGISARALQRFLTEARWSDETVIGRLRILGPRLGHPEAVWVFDGQRLPQAGQEVGGSGPAVLRQAGQGGQLPGWDVPGLRQPAGPGVGGQAAVSAQSTRWAPEPVGARPRLPWATGSPAKPIRRCWSGSMVGLPQAEWVAGADAFGMSPTFREGLAALGIQLRATFRAALVWPLEGLDQSGNPGFGRPRKPKLRPGQRRTMEQPGDELPDEAWREITVAQGSQGPRTYRFRPSGCGPPGGASPARNCGPSGPEPGPWQLSHARGPWRLWPSGWVQVAH